MDLRAADPILLTGASGYVGSRLLPELLARGHAVRALARNPARLDLPDEVTVHEGDAVAGTGLDEALAGCRTAYYLIHSMGRGSGPSSGFADRDQRAAANFGRAAARAGVERVVYIGGLGSPEELQSEHLRSRHDVARVLREHVAGLVYVRAAMVIGAGSASFVMLRHLVERLPVMVAPRWIDTRSQPVAIADVVRVLADLAELADVPDEVELGGADVLSYREMMEQFARVVGRRPPSVLPVPVFSPRLSSYWVSLVTRVELDLVQPLVDGMGTTMIVEVPPPAGINDEPRDFSAAVAEALAP